MKPAIIYKILKYKVNLYKKKEYTIQYDREISNLLKKKSFDFNKSKEEVTSFLLCCMNGVKFNLLFVSSRETLKTKRIGQQQT